MAEQDELLSQMQDKPYTVDPKSGRKTIDPSRFTLLDAQIHYNEIHGLDTKSSKQSKFTPKGGLKEFGNITIEEIAMDPKKFVDDLIVKAKGNETQLTKFFQSTRLILGEIKYNLPKEFDNLASALPNMEATDRETITFFQNLASTPEKTYANLAIIDEPANVRAFFNGLDAHANAVSVDAPTVDAIKFGANTGLRPSLITDLKMKEVHKLSDGTYALIVDTQKVGAKDSPTKAGGRKSSKTFRIPLNDEATAIVRERLAAAEKLGLGPNDDIFFIEKFSGKNKKDLKIVELTTKHMNDVLSEIEVPDGFVEDLADQDPDTNIGRVYNTLHIDKEGRPKSGSQLLRNLHTHLATRAGVDPGIIDFLQGRVSEQSIAQRLGYLTTHSRATFSGNIYDNLNKFNLYFNTTGVAQRIYPSGEEGRKLIEQTLEERRKDIARQGEVDLSARTSAQDDVVRDNKAEVRKTASELLGFDPEKDSKTLKGISSAFINKEDFNNFLVWAENNTDHDLRTAIGLNAAEIEYSADASRRATKTGLRLAAQGEEADILAEQKASTRIAGGNYDIDGMLHLSEAEEAEIMRELEGRPKKPRMKKTLSASQKAAAKRLGLSALGSVIAGPAGAVEVGLETIAGASPTQGGAEEARDLVSDMSQDELLQTLQSDQRTDELELLSDYAANEARERISDRSIYAQPRGGFMGTLAKERTRAAQEEITGLEAGLEQRAMKPEFQSDMEDLMEEGEGSFMREYQGFFDNNRVQ